MTKMHSFIQSDWINTDEWHLVVNIANEFNKFLQLPETINQILQTNKPSAKSSEIQNLLLNKAIELGFINESKGLFSEYKNNRLRPDYYLKLPNDTGILMEVERGKTNQNNMDFLDFWKCHICNYAHYLFLIVPQELRQNTSGKISGKPFETVINHFEPLFIPKNYTNVRGAYIFGY
jgi:hypothetical protein